MKKLIPVFTILSLVLFLLACGENKPATTETDSPAATTAPANDKPLKTARLDKDPAELVINRFSKNIELTEEQKTAIKDLASDFDLAGETRYEKRVKLKDFRDEVFQTIITEEQRAFYEKRKTERGDKKPNKKG